jgi:hypothetical protein
MHKQAGGCIYSQPNHHKYTHKYSQEDATTMKPAQQRTSLDVVVKTGPHHNKEPRKAYARRPNNRTAVLLLVVVGFLVAYTASLIVKTCSYFTTQYSNAGKEIIDDELLEARIPEPIVRSINKQVANDVQKANSQRLSFKSQVKFVADVNTTFHSIAAGNNFIPFRKHLMTQGWRKVAKLSPPVNHWFVRQQQQMGDSKNRSSLSPIQEPPKQRPDIGVFFVGSVLSFHAARALNPNALVNNLGIKECMWGSKRGQLQCRRALAAEHGCDFNSLGIQPMQYDLGSPVDCRAFMIRASEAQVTGTWWVSKSSRDDVSSSVGAAVWQPQQIMSFASQHRCPRSEATFNKTRWVTRLID